MHNKPAPDFALDATSGEQIKLKDLLGSFVVLIFYPANDTPVCNSQLSEMSLNTQDLLARNSLVFGVNTAPLAKSGDYCTRRRLSFPILSDPGGQVAKQYKSFTSWIGLNRRTVVIVDPKGNICFFERGNPKPEKILEKIDQVRRDSNLSPVVE